MAGMATKIACAAACLFTTATGSFAYGTIMGQLPQEQEPMRGAVFIHNMDHPPASPYSVPFFAAPCAGDGSFSIMLPPGRYLVGSGISISGTLYAVQPDPLRRLPIAGPKAQIVNLKDNTTQTLSLSAGESNPQLPGRGSASRQQDPQLVTVTGTVRDEGGAPVPLAVVTLLDPAQHQRGRNRVYMSIPTDGNGRYTIEQVRAQTYLLEAVAMDPHRGYMKGEMPEIDLTAPHNPLRYDITISPSFPPAPTAQNEHPPAGPAISPKPQPSTSGPLIDPASL
jgi:hypothetical protein